MTFDLVLVVVLGVAVYRLVRVFTRDSLTENLRTTLFDWAYTLDLEPRGPFRPYIYEVLTCPLCLGVWLSVGATCAALGWPWGNWRAGEWLLTLFAVAGVQALASGVDDRLAR